MIYNNGILDCKEIEGTPVEIKLVRKDTIEYKATKEMTASKIVIHNTGNIGTTASADSNNNFMNVDDYVLWHFTVDENKIIQGLSLLRHGWHAGDGRTGCGNRKGIGIEIVDSGSKEDVMKAIENAYKLMNNLQREFKQELNIELDITKHQDYSGKYCPAWILNNIGWNQFVRQYKLFKDNKHWAEEAYYYLNDNGIKVYDKRYDDNITRGEAFSLLERLIKNIERKRTSE